MAEPGKFEQRLQEFLRQAVELGASDIHLKTGLPPVVRIHDELKLLSRQSAALSFEDLGSLCQEILPERLRAAFAQGAEIDMAYSFSGVGRFRFNIYRYRGQIGMVGRHIPFEIRSLEELGLPPILKKLALQKRGLLLITGNTGSGKSTTLAALLNEWNTHSGGHIITIEDPVEYLIRDRKSIVTQREVGLDTESFSKGLKNALRQDPDVIMIGEMRDRETIQIALNAAETGHLVLSTLHTKDAHETLNRILGVFDPEAQREVRVQFASALAAVVSQRLIPRAPVNGRSPGLIPAVEVLINSARVRDCLLDPDRGGEIQEAIEQGHEHYGMQTFDQHLMALLRRKLITVEQALLHSSNPADFELRLRGIDSSDGNRWSALKDGVAQSPQEIKGPTLELELPLPAKPVLKKVGS